MREKLENLIHSIFVKMESVQRFNAELREKLNSKETELGEIASKLKIYSNELPEKINTSLKNQMQKILRQVKQNLGRKNDM